jgi:hypothetical protein
MDADSQGDGVPLPRWWTDVHAQSSHTRFLRKEKVGEGTYAVVYDAVDRYKQELFINS